MYFLLLFWPLIFVKCLGKGNFYTKAHVSLRVFSILLCGTLAYAIVCVKNSSPGLGFVSESQLGLGQRHSDSLTTATDEPQPRRGAVTPPRKPHCSVSWRETREEHSHEYMAGIYKLSH